MNQQAYQAGYSTPGQGRRSDKGYYPKLATGFADQYVAWARMFVTLTPTVAADMHSSFVAGYHAAGKETPMSDHATQPGLFEQTPGPPDLIAECGILSPAMRQIVGAANLSPARQLQILAELANGQTTARSLNARVAVLARQQAQGAADGDQMQWGR